MKHFKVKSEASKQIEVSQTVRRRYSTPMVKSMNHFKLKTKKRHAEQMTMERSKSVDLTNYPPFNFSQMHFKPSIESYNDPYTNTFVYPGNAFTNQGRLADLVQAGKRMGTIYNEY